MLEFILKHTNKSEKFFNYILLNKLQIINSEYFESAFYSNTFLSIRKSSPTR